LKELIAEKISTKRSMQLSEGKTKKKREEKDLKRRIDT